MEEMRAWDANVEATAERDAETEAVTGPQDRAHVIKRRRRGGGAIEGSAREILRRDREQAVLFFGVAAVASALHPLDLVSSRSRRAPASRCILPHRLGDCHMVDCHNPGGLRESLIECVLIAIPGGLCKIIA
uniref:Uncharacterized protein n=1 Tax=Leersia perrieri TaxID=77586 RepID=A0A0D9V2J5_9ORYZ